MNTEIRQALRALYIQFFSFALIPVLLIVAYETDILSVGLYAEDTKMQYIMETIGILVTIAFVPLALIVFRFIHKWKIENAELPTILRRYIYLCMGRFALLEVVVLLNVVVSYSTLNNAGGFCILVALAAAFFCLPSKKRLYTELNMQQPADE
jgi:hypothetical protein